jgi:hypothetical protein
MVLCIYARSFLLHVFPEHTLRLARFWLVRTRICEAPSCLMLLPCLRRTDLCSSTTEATLDQLMYEKLVQMLLVHRILLPQNAPTMEQSGNAHRPKLCLCRTRRHRCLHLGNKPAQQHRSR